MFRIGYLFVFHNEKKKAPELDEYLSGNYETS